MRPYEVLIAAREALLASLARASSEAGLRLRDCVRSSADLRQKLQHGAPDLLFVDASLGQRYGGIEVVAADELGRDIATILVDDAVDQELLTRMQRVGVDGFLVWPATREQFEATVCAALGARQSRPPPTGESLQQASAALLGIARQLAKVRHLVPPVAAGPVLRPLPELESLSRREWEVLRGLASHQRVPTLARQLHISPHTVRNHLKSIFSKLSVHSQAELLDKVIDRNATLVAGGES